MEIGQEAGRLLFRGVGVATASRRPLPEFAVIGAKRGGTTTLFYELLAHPQVLPMFPSGSTPLKRNHTKGTHYFVPGRQRSERYYRSWFPTTAARARAAARLGRPVITGEASPYYLFHPLAPARAHAMVPDLKLIALLRDPVERTISHYREQRRNGIETLGLLEALEAEAERTEGEEERILADPGYVSSPHENQSYRAQSEYGRCVARWLEHYPREQLLVLASEDFYARPQEAYDRITDFLGVERHVLGQVGSRNAAPRQDVDPEVRARLAASFQADAALLTQHTGQRMPWAWVKA